MTLRAAAVAAVAAVLLPLLAASASAQEVRYNLEEVLEASDVVDAVSSAGDVDHSKPCPDVFEAGLQKAGVTAAEAIVVGDTPFDILAAERAGLRTIAFRSGLFRDDQLIGAIAIYDDAADLLARFEDSPLSRASAPA